MYTSILTYHALVFPVCVCVCGSLWGECLQWLHLIQGLIYNRFPGDTNDDLEIKLFISLAGSKTWHDYPISLDVSQNRTHIHTKILTTQIIMLYLSWACLLKACETICILFVYVEITKTGWKECQNEKVLVWFFNWMFLNDYGVNIMET